METDSAIRLMEENIALNELSSQVTDRVSVEAKVLDWEQPLPSWVGDNDSWLDLIMCVRLTRAEKIPLTRNRAADVTYNTASFPSLITTLSSLLDPPHTSAKTPMLLLAYKQRDPAERSLWSLLEEKGVELQMVDGVRGSEEDGKVEVWIGRHTMLGIS